MFQYILTIALVLAVAIYAEVFTISHATGFGCVWFGLATSSFDSVRRAGRLEQTT